MIIPTPPTDDDLQEARAHGVRVFLWGLLVDVSTAIVLILLAAFRDIQWTREYWAALGLMLAKSILQAVVAYLARRLLPPPKI
jgi:hypothetical protein